MDTTTGMMKRSMREGKKEFRIKKIWLGIAAALAVAVAAVSFYLLSAEAEPEKFWSYDLGHTVGPMLLVDMNGDGEEELFVVGEVAGGNIRLINPKTGVAYANGTGTFTISSTITNITAGDWDNDGRLEVMVPTGTNSPGVRVYEMNWTGSAWELRQLASFSTADPAYAVAFGDFWPDGSNTPDVIVGMRGSRFIMTDVGVYSRGTGSALSVWGASDDFSSMAFAPNYLVNSNYYSLALGGGGGRQTQLYRRTSSSNQTPSNVRVGNSITETKIMAMNFTSTTYQDFVVASKNGTSSKLYVFNGSNTNTALDYTAPDTINDFSTGDLNNDGVPDFILAIGGTDRRVRVVNGANATVLASSNQYATTVRAVVYGEVDGDRTRPDIVAGTTSSGLYSLSYNGTTTLQQKAKSLATANNVGTRYNLLLTNVNGNHDTVQDIIVGEERNNSVANIEAFTLDQTPPVISPPNPPPRDVSDVSGSTYGPTTTFNVYLDESAYVTLRVYSDAARTNVVKTLASDYRVDKSVYGWTYAATWDGSGNIGSGTYYYSIIATDNERDIKPAVDYTTNTSVYNTGSLQLDMTPPTAAITGPAADGAGVTGMVTITGTAADDYAPHFLEYSVEYEKFGAGNWTAIGANPRTTAVTNGTLATWDTSSLPEDEYRIRLTVKDKYGHTSVAYRRVIRDVTGPNITLSYFKDSGFTNPLTLDGTTPITTIGSVYARVYANELLNGPPKLTITGTANNNRTAAVTEKVSDFVYRYKWDVIYEGTSRATATVAVEAYDRFGNATVNPDQVTGRNVIVDTYANPTTINNPRFNAGTGNVELTWSSVSDAVEYRIWRKTGSSGVDTTGPPYWTVTSAAYNDPVGTVTQSVYYVVKVLDIVNNLSPVSNEVYVTPPRPATLTLSASPTAVVANGVEASTITATLKDQYDNPLSGQQINFATNLGTLSAASAVTDSNGRASVTITSNTTGTATVTGTVNSAPAVTGSTSVNFTSLANTINMTVSPDNVPANNTSTSTVAARVLDSGSQPLADGTLVTFTITAGTGTFSDGTTTKVVPISGGNGIASVQVKSGTVNTVTVKAEAAGKNNTANVNFVAQAVTSITVTASPTTIKADGAETSTITATVYDQDGKPMGGGVTVNFTTTLGTLSAAGANTNSSGQATVTLKSNNAGTATVTASNGGKSANVNVILEVPDNIPPALLRAEPTSKQLLYLTFSEPIKFVPDPPVGWAVYKFVGASVYNVSFGTPYLVPGDKRIVRLAVYDSVYGNQYPNPLQYKIVVNSVYDLNNNVLDTVYNSAYWDGYTPHGKYSRLNVTDVNNSRLCGQCHVTHSAVGKQLLNRTTVKKVCFICHGTAGTSDYRVESEFTSRTAGGSLVSYSLHKSLDVDNPAGNDVLYCTDCHNPHGDRRPGTNNIYPKLLKAADVAGTVYTSGNGYCLACHGANNKLFKTGYNMSVFYAAYGGDHRYGMTAQAGGPVPHYNPAFAVMAPASGTNVTCVKCHERHGSRYWRLQDNTRANSEEDQCYKCHGKDVNYGMTGGYNVYTKVTTSVSKHRVEDTVYGRVECSSCHGPHTVGGAKHNAGLSYSAISDPDNTKNPFTTANGSFSQFCLKCHDGSPPAAAIGETTIVPYTVSFVNQNFRTNAGGWNKTAGYSYLNSAHYTNANMDSQTDAYGNKRKDCSNCHEWHGTAYKWLVNNPEDTSGTDGVCLRCHKPSGFTGAADVKTTLTALYRHPTLYVSGKHSNTEDYSSITTADRHAACYDCHDPHAAQVGNNPARAPFVQRAVYNVSGVNTPARGAGTSLAKGSYVWTNPAVYEWQVCYKCHSSYANLPTGKRDIAAEFNPANLSFHFVEGTNTRTHNVNTYRGVDRYGAAWTYNSKMYCGDCHGAAASAWNAEPSVQGPHGSANADILKGWWSTASGLSASQNLWNNRNTFLCFRCHNPNFYGGWGGTESNGSYFTDNGTANGHNSIVRKEHRVPCAACHGAKVHGKNRDHLISLSGDDSPSVSKNTGYTHRTNGQYAKNDCTTSGCASYYNIDTNSPTYQQSKDH